MFETLMITFREGLEAFLIIAITIAYLTKTGGEKLIPSVRSACYVAIIACIILGIALAKIGGLTPFWEGTLALTAAILVISCTMHMLKMGKHMKSEITGAIDKAVANPGSGAKAAIFAFVLLMIGREGLEAATMIASLAQSNDSTNLVVGGVLGLIVAGAVAAAWSKYGHRINLGLFFQVTAAFMVIFSIQLLIYAFHEYTESIEVANLGIIDNAYWHAATETFGPQGRVGAWISYSLVLVPLAFLAYSFLTSKNASKLVSSH
ncbi:MULTISPECIES: FTR1 family iron permease [Methylotenera]|uniref:FTR1 family iron permease n=1 Tax=Methylotenera TaxID=359407 RepID=UPI00037BF968|nr:MULTISPECIES: FTR1 family protein [Methylotenera]